MLQGGDHQACSGLCAIAERIQYAANPLASGYDPDISVLDAAHDARQLADGVLRARVLHMDRILHIMEILFQLCIVCLERNHHVIQLVNVRSDRWAWPTTKHSTARKALPGRLTAGLLTHQLDTSSRHDFNCTSRWREKVVTRNAQSHADCCMTD